MSFDDRVRAALREMIEKRAGTDRRPGYTTIARAMGRCHNWLVRKLVPQASDPRPMTLQDVDAVLVHIDADPAELLRRARAIKA